MVKQTNKQTPLNFCSVNRPKKRANFIAELGFYLFVLFWKALK